MYSSLTAIAGSSSTGTGFPTGSTPSSDGPEVEESTHNFVLEVITIVCPTVVALVLVIALSIVIVVVVVCILKHGIG